MRPDEATGSGTTALLCGIFFLAGASALLFESLWFRQAGLVFGNGVWASSLVLAAFMAGLAVGSGAVARYGDRIRRPLYCYAGIELAIALTGVLIVVGLPLLAPLLKPILAPRLEPWATHLIRLGAGFAVLLVPATGMGATLPILVQALSSRDPNFGSALGRLYGWNTLGAVLGAVAGEAALLAWLGVRGSALFAAGLGMAVATAAATLAPRFAPADPASRAPAEAQRSGAGTQRLLAASFLSGFALLALEVVWFRFLLLFLHGTSLVFSVMLGVVLTGIALGGLVAGRVLQRRPSAYRLAPLLSVLSCIAVIALYGGFSLLPPRERYIAGWLDTVQYGAALMLLPALLSGAVFTCLGTALARKVSPPTRTAGWMVLWNTLGSGLGSLAGGFLLLPWLGIERSFVALAALYLVVAWLALPAARNAAGRAPAGWPICVAAGLLALLLFPAASMRDTYLQRSIGRFLAGGRQVVTVTEGRSETIVLLASHFLGAPVEHVLFTNGHPMSSTQPEARRYMKLFAVLPNAFAPSLGRALLISYGVGNTAQALVDTPGLERLDVVDVSREILGMSSTIHPQPGSDPLDDQRVRVHVEDGRHFLQTTNLRFDLITGEPPPPKSAGIVSLYTREYFRLSRDRLSETGIHTYWLPVHSITPSDARAIVGAYCEVFHDCTLWNGTAGDWVLAGSRGRDWRVADEVFSAAWRDPQRLPALREIALEHPEQLAATFIADAAQLRAFVDAAAPLTDDFPKRLDDLQPRKRDVWPEFEPWVDAEGARRRFEESSFVRHALSPRMRARALPWFDAQAVLNRHTAAGYGFVPRRPGSVIRDLDLLLRETDLETLPLWLVGLELRKVALMEAATPHERRRTPILWRRGLAALALRDPPQAVHALQTASTRGPRGVRSLHYRLYALCTAGRREEAQRVLTSELQKLPQPARIPGAWSWLPDLCGFEAPEHPSPTTPTPRPQGASS